MSEETEETTDTQSNDTVETGDTRGRRFVLVLYVALVGVAATAGVLTATFVDGLSRPELFGVIPLPATRVGFAVFGGVTMAFVLGVPLSLIIYVSRRIDDPDAVE
ncbi:MAG: hypothetical protein J07HB67_01938 [halophilic archaeon J07HB67]|nr:MAG: hypothetical protein J07HB67_01938 [halophilic archaeon J07HB67]